MPPSLPTWVQQQKGWHFQHLSLGQKSRTFRRQWLWGYVRLHPAPDETRSGAAQRFGSSGSMRIWPTEPDAQPLWRTQLGWNESRHLSRIDTTPRHPGLTREQVPTSEEWLDKAMSTISHRLIEPWERLMKSNATAADKSRPSQVMKDRAPGWGGAKGGGGSLDKNAAFRCN